MQHRAERRDFFEQQQVHSVYLINYQSSYLIGHVYLINYMFICSIICIDGLNSSRQSPAFHQAVDFTPHRQSKILLHRSEDFGL